MVHYFQQQRLHTGGILIHFYNVTQTLFSYPDSYTRSHCIHSSQYVSCIAQTLHPLGSLNSLLLFKTLQNDLLHE